MRLSRRHFLAGSVGVCVAGCATQPLSPVGVRPTIEVFSPLMAEIVSSDATLETLGTGYQWAEGPVWDPTRQVLYFTDVPQNKAYVWRSGQGVSIFLDPSGGTETQGFREPGANGLLIGQDGRLLICNHGHRAVEAMDLETKTRDVLAAQYLGDRFNSPNDIVQSRQGDLYFTDPPYGLEGLDASPLKEMEPNGVYHLSPDSTVTRLIADMTFPNGIALSPDETHLYVSQSDPDAPLIRRLSPHDTSSDQIWFDASPFMRDGPGLPDGMAVAASGHVFATGPGGVFVLTPDGTPLGRINPGRACANCTFGEDGQTLFITAQDRLMRVKLKVQGLGWT